MISPGTLLVLILFPFECLYLTLYAIVFPLVYLWRLLFPGKPLSLEGKVILVTGGANGIGRAICEKLVEIEKNLTIIIWDLDQNTGLETIKALRSAGVQNAFVFKVDVSDREQVAAAAQQIRDEIGEVSLLFNNAGIAGPAIEAWKEDPSVTEKVFRVNMLSHCWTMQEFLPPMIAAGEGNVVEICSILGFIPSPYGSSYCTSKHAIRGYIESVKEEVRHLSSKPKIVFSTVYPHNVSTKLITGFNLDLTRYTFLNVTLTPESAASEIVKGVRYGKEHIYIPGRYRSVHCLVELFPPAVTRKVFDFAGMPLNKVEVV